MNIEKKIQLIQDETAVESSNIVRYENASDFPAIYKKMQDNGLDIFFDPKTKIIGKKGTAEWYIAQEKDGQNIAYITVKDRDLLKSLISDITEENTRVVVDMGGNAGDQAMVDIIPTKEGKEEIVLTLQKELADLQKEIITFKDIDNLCGLLLIQYNELRKKLEGARTNAPKEWIKNPIYQNNLAKLVDVVKTQRTHIEDIQKKSAAQRVSAYQENTPNALAEWKAKLDYIHAQFSSVDKFYQNPDHMISNDVDITAYNIDTPLYQAKDVEKLLKKIGAQREEIRKINELQFNLDLTKIDKDEQQRFRQYLNGVLDNTIDPATEKFVPEHAEKFAGLLAQYPWLTQYFSSKKPFEAGETYRIEGTESLDPTDPKFQEAIKKDPRYNDRKDALARGGIAGLASYGLDKTNMTPEQKQFRGGVGQLAMVGGAVYVGWKMLSSAFNLVFGTYKGDDKKKERRNAIAWLLGPAAIIFGLQATTGEGIGGIVHGGKGTEWLANLFGGKKTHEHLTVEQEKRQREFLDKYGEGMVGAISVFNGMNYGQIKELLELKDGKMKLKKESYDTFIDKFTNITPNPGAINFLRSIGENDDNNIIDLSLNAMNVSRDKLNDPSHANYEINEAYSITSAKVVGLVAFMEEHLYAKINPDMMDKIENEYLKNEDATYDDLDDLVKKYPDLFLKEDIKDKTGIPGMADKLRDLAGGDKDKEAGLIIGMNMFYEYMPTGEKNIELIGNGPEIQFKTYGQTTKINIDSKTLVGFTPSSFDSYFELFKAANLTNRIQDLCKDKVSVKPNPFYIAKANIPGLEGITDAILGDIMFNTAEIFSLDRDFNVQTAGMFGKLEGISPILEEYKDDYMNYLNGIRNRKIKPPEVEQLDTLPAALVTTINTIVGNNPEKADILKGLQEFYTKRPTADRTTLEITGTWPNVNFTTYGETTKIDLKDKNIVRLEGSSAFKDYAELFRAVNLTNYIKKTCKSESTEKGLPYEVGYTGIIFKGKDKDINVISTGRFGKLDNVSETLSKNKEKYANYLNTTWDKTGNGEKIRTMANNQELELKILNSVNLFYEQMPSDRKDRIKISGTLNNATFTTYDKTTHINLSSRTINGLGVVFPDDADDNYLELLKATSLTNRIIDIFEDEVGTENPFNISRPGADIEFEHKSFWKVDTEAVSAGRWSGLEDISPTLNTKTNVEVYKNYLNTLKFRKTS